MSDFDDRPFVAGSLTGLRSFKVDNLGRLRGVNYGAVFQPGENEARCLLDHGPASVWGQALTSYSIIVSTVTTSIGGTEPEKTAAKEEAPAHRPGTLGCRCGFYAYFDDGPNTFHDDGQVLAVVEGYGVCTVGSRGFRAEKARLLGIIDGAELRPWWRRARWLFWMWTVCLLINLLCVAVGPFIFGWDAVSFGISTGAAAWCAGALWLNRRSLFHPQPKKLPALVRRNYPDVPVYRTQKEALRAHPLTPPPPPPVPSPDTDEDFWTRGDLT